MNNDQKNLEALCDSEEFRHFLEQQLKFIDEILSRLGRRVSERPMMASMYFVEHCIVDSDKRPPPDYLEQEWFGRILEITTGWYRDRFGAGLLEIPDSFTGAVVSLFGTAFQVRIPNFPTLPGEKSGTVVVFFAQEVLGHEEPLDWVVPRPKLSGLSHEVAEEVLRHVRTVCNLTRKIDWGLTFALLATGQLRDQAQSILGHFEKGAADICGGRHGAAMWEFHLAVEISLKLFLGQRGVSPIPHTHELPVLVQLASSNGLPPTDPIILTELPTHTDAIKYRYSEIEEPPLHKAIEIYQAALRLVGHVADNLDHDKVLSPRKCVYLQALPWHPSRKSDSTPQIK
jgi:HEPN domain-containing protein